MSEAKFVELFEKRAKEIYPDSHISRIESPITAPGYPDVDFCARGVNVQIEFKYSENGLPPEIRPTQVRWFKKRIKAGGRPFILAKILVEDEWLYFLVLGGNIENLARASSINAWISRGSAYRIFDEDEMNTGGWFSIFHIMMKRIL